MRATAIVTWFVILFATVAWLGATYGEETTPIERLAKITKANRALRVAIADVKDERDALKDERDAQNEVIEDLQAQNAKLRARDPLDQVLARDADGRWQAMLELWRAQPTLAVGSRCGYDKTQDALPDTFASFTFYRWTLC